SKKILMPNPTWGNHVAIFKNSGLEPGYYRYFDAKNNKVGMSIGICSGIAMWV
ncbi:aminotransferase class I/II-fold pyridoxal phosphate-dependent enzyme, partial [archaeon]